MKTTLLGLFLMAVAPASPAAGSQLLSWNNLGMHCMDSDYSVFSVLPPYNTIEGQLIVSGKLVTNGVGYTVSYQAVADPDGSLNSTAMGKGNFYTFAAGLFGTALAPEAGLAGWGMPGPGNVPQLMVFESTNHPAPGAALKVNWFRAEGIPISPYDDAGRKNPYPLMRLIARDGSGTPLATNDIVLPVSDEMDCRACHASGTHEVARPAAGWVWSGKPERDFRLNILRMHDEHQFANHSEVYAAALAARGFDSGGLYRGVVAGAKPVLCAACHASEALGTGSFDGIPPLTASVHATHATVLDPDLGVRLDDSSHRDACYRCHPGSATKCLRGAMGSAVAADGSKLMQCQGCHGSMSQVGSLNRVGWFMEPNCQSCHSGHATSHGGQIRFTSVFNSDGSVRVPGNRIFATQSNTPAAGLSLYRFSVGHGGLQCSACHGSTHAEFPATHGNDNLRNVGVQGHAGVTAECTACHVSMPNNASTAVGGPHGMHPLGQAWVDNHPDIAERSPGLPACATCHGADYRGSVLSQAFGPRTLTARLEGGTVVLNLFRGAMVGCYNCHNGPSSEGLNTRVAPVVRDVAAQTVSGLAVPLELPVSGINAAARIIAQPVHGSVALSASRATYHPDPGFVGIDTFSFAAWDGSKNSSLAIATVVVAEGPYSIAVKALVPLEYPVGWSAPFGAVTTVSNTLATVGYEWNFGDGSALDTQRHATHAYATPGNYAWSLNVRAGTAMASTRGSITIGGEPGLSILAGTVTRVRWSRTPADAVLETSTTLEAAGWQTATNAVHATPTTFSADVATLGKQQYFRLRRVE